MKKGTLLLLFLILIASTAFRTSEKPTLSLTVKNITSVKGNIMLAVFSSSTDFPNSENAEQRLVFPISQKNPTVTIKGLKVGQKYALALYHDENNNKTLDKNLFGLPTEKYGFSNNARGAFGPPDFEEAAFVFNGKSVHSVTLE